MDIKDSFDNKLLTINFDYDGKVTSVEDIDGNSISYTYSGDNIVSVTDRNGDSTTYEYDGNDILYRIVGADGNAYVENSYDSKGRVLTQKDGAGNLTQFNYEVDDTTYIITKTTVTYPDGTIQEYDNLYNRVSSTTMNGSNIAYEYDANGKISKLTNQDGNSWKFTRNGQRFSYRV